MKRLDSAEVVAWWALAETDLRVAEALTSLDPPAWGAVCFHCQQAVEKALKALLEAMSLPVPRTHDLVTRVDLLAPSVPGIGDFADVAAFLNAFAVGPRYPSFSGPASAEEARFAVVRATALLGEVRALLESE